ncbi:hypothetical protein LTR95_016900 [Oleoguttula sp. CCFEE 5521]|uniref:Uncharacterized protein n=1 Tax=Cryoendolithus antarcticus TaxID=1507870 RepID=A0A1V8S7A5_9PEZI|nr:hypothetical protein B0A48_18797 [Cryoendolithus antarcticus]
MHCALWHRWTTQRVLSSGLEGFHISRQRVEIRNAVYAYITKTDLSEEEVELVEGSLFRTETTEPPLLLIRGMIAGGMFGFALRQKRWRVNYGLAARSPPTKVAVPYRATDQHTALDLKGRVKSLRTRRKRSRTRQVEAAMGRGFQAETCGTGGPGSDHLSDWTSDLY